MCCLPLASIYILINFEKTAVYSAEGVNSPYSFSDSDKKGAPIEQYNESTWLESSTEFAIQRQEVSGS